MELGLARQDEYEQVDALVAGSDLPLDDIELCRAAQYVVRDGDEVVATAALEIRGRDAILRSVAVASGRRGERLGERIVAHTIEEARQRDLRGLYLLTETASGFFPRFGFVQEDRGDAPPAIQESAEYCHVCGSHAIAMALSLEGAP